MNAEDKSSNDGESISCDIDEASDKEVDEFGIDQGGFCCFMNNLPIVYLRMWLNEKPQMTSFISQRIPDEQPAKGIERLVSITFELLVM